MQVLNESKDLFGRHVGMNLHDSSPLLSVDNARIVVEGNTPDLVAVGVLDLVEWLAKCFDEGFVFCHHQNIHPHHC